jgi:hypothetical protein
MNAAVTDAASAVAAHLVRGGSALVTSIGAVALLAAQARVTQPINPITGEVERIGGLEVAQDQALQARCGQDAAVGQNSGVTRTQHVKQ